MMRTARVAVIERPRPAEVDAYGMQIQEKTGKKPAEELRRTRAPPDARDLNGSAAELLDGVQMADPELGNTFDFTRAKLRGADFSGADLQGANPSEADLEGDYRDRTDLSRANLESADLSRSILSYTDFSNAVLRDADISEPHPSRGYHVDQLFSDTRSLPATGDFQSADLTGVDASEAVLL